MRARVHRNEGNTSRTRTRTVLAGLALAAALVGGVAWATIPAADGTIHGCYTKSNGNLRIALNNTGTVARRRIDGFNDGTFAVGAQPWGVAFDGSSIGVSNRGSNSVTKLRASDGAVLTTIAVGANPAGVAFDGTSIWVTNLNSGTVSKRTG